MSFDWIGASPRGGIAGRTLESLRAWRPNLRQLVLTALLVGQIAGCDSCNGCFDLDLSGCGPAPCEKSAPVRCPGFFVGSCANLDSDRDHCGSCGTVCPSGARCDDGECVCPGGLAACDTCTDLQSDADNCGVCGRRCVGEGSRCVEGRCTEPTCRNGRLDPGETGTDCGGTCPPCVLGGPCLVAADCVVPGGAGNHAFCMVEEWLPPPVDAGTSDAPDGATEGDGGDDGGADGGLDGADGGDPVAVDGGLDALALDGGSPGDWARILWAGGYCSATCRVRGNRPDGTNPDCPIATFGRSLCLGIGKGDPQCLAPCLSAAHCRAGYVCGGAAMTRPSVCLPAPMATCDTGDPASCPFGEACTTLYSPDGSMGICRPMCDPFAQDCPGAMVPRGCVADPWSGLGACIDEVSESSIDGTVCLADEDCAAGLGCRVENGWGTCRRYCGGLRAVSCPAGQRCVDLSSRVSATVVGICTTD